jgi:E3 ubiquitin-protein ligase RNF217
VSIRERYQQILARDLSENQNTFIKLCPHCNFITILDENDPIIRRKKSRRSSREWIHCEQCEKEWCWSCYAPSHPNETCRQFKKNHSQLDLWAKTRRSDNKNQRNAQRCPKCLIYIEKIDGCDHMICSKCNSKFCYRCGSRMRLPFYVGHDAKYSIFGCKYKLCPNRPLLRWLIRGSIFTSVLLLTPVLLGALIALIAIGIPTVLIIGFFSLPVFVCLDCKRQS